MSGPAIPKTSLQLYRDCLRLIRHIAPGTRSNKSQALQAMVRLEFGKHRAATDPHEIQALQAQAVRGLSNYMLTQAGRQDTKLNTAMQDYHGRSVQQLATNAKEKAALETAKEKTALEQSGGGEEDKAPPKLK